MRITESLENVVLAEIHVWVGDDHPVWERMGLQVFTKSKLGPAEVTEILFGSDRLEVRVTLQLIGHAALARKRAVVDHDHAQRRVQ